MTDWTSLLKGQRVVRLNATLFPVDDYEAETFARYGLAPVLVEATTPEEMIPHVAECDAVCVVSASMPAWVMESLSKCRVISRYGIGTDKLAVDMATRQGILVTNVPEFCTDEMGDHAMTLLLAVARNLPAMSQALADGAWSRARRLANTSRRLAGHVLGLVGFGHSAQALAKRAKGFGLQILATRRNMNVPSRVADELGVKMVDLDTLLAKSDYVSLHLPLGPDTYHLLDETMLRKMKPDAVLINVARGAIVDETALVAALREGRLGGAGIDTFQQINPFTEVETPPQHPFLELDNVVLTPHVAALSADSKRELVKGAIENLVTVLSGHWPCPEHRVNPDVMPRVPLADYDSQLLKD